MCFCFWLGIGSGFLNSGPNANALLSRHLYHLVKTKKGKNKLDHHIKKQTRATKIIEKGWKGRTARDTRSKGWN